ncbi:MAG TPA: L-alanine exporter AlaE [Candidatus Paceibacterota bacterium]|nr:L-alanine exporter AlaE [Candidatus Paceibacterota bacterium]
MKLKRFLIDTLALNVFIIFTAFFVEVVFSGIAWSIFWKGRLIMIIPNTIVVDPYNRTRIWIGERLEGWRSEKMRQIVRDTVTFVIYRVPLVFLVLSFLGAPRKEIISACVFATLISGFTGRPYGMFLDWMRRVFKV